MKTVRHFYSIFFFTFFSGTIAFCQPTEENRKIISLNGEWQLAQTQSFDEIPYQFDHTIPVPGLVDLAQQTLRGTDEELFNDKIYWYKREVNLENTDSEVILLKLYKAKYHTKVFLNGQFIGENPYSFTPSYFDIKEYLNEPGESNDLIIGVGSMNMLPDTVANGWDFEKLKYIPGIYDEVEIIQAGYPFISNVQIAPDVEDMSIRVRTWLAFEEERPRPGRLTYLVRELHSGEEVSRGEIAFFEEMFDFRVEIPDGRLWSPEDPFLYTLELGTSSDNRVTRFGLRSFEFRAGEPMGFLNKEPYYLRGTNVTLYRFFEDLNRGELPWDDEWVTQLLTSFKEMNWNSVRFCIGFPPERWYEIADSIGLMIQDEFPLWTLRQRRKVPLAESLVSEYTAWMEERWNHPSVIIWDAQNESITEETGKAIQQVRSLDMSNRPWDNGWAPPQSDTDPIEAHPYLFDQYMQERQAAVPSSEGPMKDLLTEKRVPDNDPNQQMPPPDGERYDNPIIINEYAWLWLNRDGSPTTLTDDVYVAITDGTLTVPERKEFYARYLAILSEYWRAHRTSAAVMHFVGLGYSRPDEPRGQTSDHFIDVEALEYDPWFLKYVRPAFAPVGLMVEFWDINIDPGRTVTIPVHIVNDTNQEFSDALYLELRDDNDQVVESYSHLVQVEPNEKKISKFETKMPEKEGNYELVVYYNSENNNSVFSARQIEVKNF